MFLPGPIAVFVATCLVAVPCAASAGEKLSDLSLFALDGAPPSAVDACFDVVKGELKAGNPRPAQILSIVTAPPIDVFTRNLDDALRLTRDQPLLTNRLTAALTRARRLQDTTRLRPSEVQRFAALQARRREVLTQCFNAGLSRRYGDDKMLTLFRQTSRDAVFPDFADDFFEAWNLYLDVYDPLTEKVERKDFVSMSLWIVLGNRSDAGALAHLKRLMNPPGTRVPIPDAEVPESAAALKRLSEGKIDAANVVYLTYVPVRAGRRKVIEPRTRARTGESFFDAMGAMLDAGNIDDETYHLLSRAREKLDDLLTRDGFRNPAALASMAQRREQVESLAIAARSGRIAAQAELAKLAEKASTDLGPYYSVSIGRWLVDWIPLMRSVRMDAIVGAPDAPDVLRVLETPDD